MVKIRETINILRPSQKNQKQIKKIQQKKRERHSRFHTWQFASRHQNRLRADPGFQIYFVALLLSIKEINIKLYPATYNKLLNL